ncbi:MAG: biotin--[acetyl-CoA-carboxylase] ligase [Akkermansiaceae bacterium]
MAIFDTAKFAAIAPGLFEKLQYHGQLESTNDEAHRIAAGGAEHGTVILAEKQTKGRGRRGAAWLSEPGEGLTFSVVLRPDFGGEHYSKIALAAGLGIATALRESFSIAAELKWPNDILIQDRKCCGILVEARDNYVVLGVGINVLKSPENAEFISISDLSSEPVSRERTLAAMIAAIMSEVKTCAEDFPSQLYRIDTISWLNGKKITFLSGEKPHVGVVEDIAGDGSLVVRTELGVKRFGQASGIRPVD